MRRGAPLGALAAAAAVGLAAEWTRYGFIEPRLWVPDVAVGWSLIAAGLMGHVRQRTSWTGLLMAGAGFAWFIGNFAVVRDPLIGGLAAQAIFLYRGPLIQAVISFPTGRLDSALEKLLVALAYVSAVPALARDDTLTAALGVGLCSVGIWNVRSTIGVSRRVRSFRAGAAVAIGALLSVGAALHLAFPAGTLDEAVDLGYAGVLCAVAFMLLVGLVRAGRDLALTDLLVQLGDTRSDAVRLAFARALGDPSLEVGYWFEQTGRFVDATGRQVAIPDVSSGRATTTVRMADRTVGILIHDPAVKTDPGLVGSIAEATGLAGANARLQAEVRAKVAEVSASRRRLVEAGEDERRRLEVRLSDGPQRRIDGVAQRLRKLAEGPGIIGVANGTMEIVARAEHHAFGALEDLGELGRGLAPRALRLAGLRVALAEMAARLPVSVRLDVSVDPMPSPVKTAIYFVCSEGLANVAKHASGSTVMVSVSTRQAWVIAVIVDDGPGGADAAGTGLRGLADRVEALGGTFRVDSHPGTGTSLTAEIPLDGQEL